MKKNQWLFLLLFCFLIGGCVNESEFKNQTATDIKKALVQKHQLLENDEEGIKETELSVLKLTPYEKKEKERIAGVGIKPSGEGHNMIVDNFEEMFLPEGTALTSVIVKYKNSETCFSMMYIKESQVLLISDSTVHEVDCGTFEMIEKENERKHKIKVREKVDYKTHFEKEKKEMHNE